MEEFEEKQSVSSIDEIKNLFGHLLTEDELRTQIDKARKKLKNEIQEKPLAAVGVAVAVGLVLGFILKR